MKIMFAILTFNFSIQCFAGSLTAYDGNKGQVILRDPEIMNSLILSSTVNGKIRVLVNARELWCDIDVDTRTKAENILQKIQRGANITCFGPLTVEKKDPTTWPGLVTQKYLTGDISDASAK